MLAVWPRADGGRQLAEESFAAFPHVVVGVTSPYAASLGNSITEWSVRRSRRLLSRQLFEFVGYGANGGDYVCPVGRFEITDLGRGLVIQLSPGIAWLHGDTFSGYDLARRLLGLAQHGREDYRPAWAEACQSVEVSGVDSVTVHFHAPQLAPAALLTISPAEPRADDATVPSLAPYNAQATTPERTTFLLGKEYFARADGQPQGIIEQRFASRVDAVDALRLGEITVVDRLPPWEVNRLKGVTGVSVEPYPVRTVHCLLPNPRSAFLRHRGFRRALVYGINRQKILSEQILERQSLAGCEVVGGPFAKGATLSDSAGYAYDDEIQPCAYSRAWP